MRIACEAASIFNQGGHTLVLTHLIEHGTLHVTRDTYQCLIRLHLNDIIILQTDISCETTIQNIVVKVDHRDETSIAIDLDGTQCSQTTGTTCAIECIEHVGKSTQMICTGSPDLTHDIHLDRTCVTHTDLQITALIT